MITQREGVALVNRRDADDTCRTLLSVKLGHRELFAGGRHRSEVITDPTAFSTHERLPGGFVVYGLIDGGWIVSGSYEDGLAGGFERLGFLWSATFGWYAGERSPVNQLSELLSFLEG